MQWRKAGINCEASLTTNWTDRVKSSTKSKRPHTDIENHEEIDDDDPRLEEITDSCDVVRRKINTFINSGEMKVTEFQRAIGVSSNSYLTFMKQHGPTKGIESKTYDAAFAFFKKRELQGIKMQRKKVKKADEDEKMDVSGIHLDGEESKEVPIYDTCNEIRKKIAAYLRGPGITQAGFLRELGKMYPEPKKISAAQLKTFQGKKGPLEGNSSNVFYAAYVFFEKIRVKQGKKKSKVREETEARWSGRGGITTEKQGGMWICHKTEAAVQDKYGDVEIVRKH